MGDGVVAGVEGAEGVLERLAERTNATVQFRFFQVPSSILDVNGYVSPFGPGFTYAYLPDQPGNVYGADGYDSMSVPPISPVKTVEQAFGQSAGILRVRHLDYMPGSESIDIGGYDLPSWPGLDGPSGQISWTASDFGDGEILYVSLEGQTQSLAVQIVAPPGTRNAHVLEMPAAFTPSELPSMLSFAFVTQADFASVPSYEDLVTGGPMPPSTYVPTMTDDAVLLFGGVD